MTYRVDGIEEGVNPHVNYEPSSMGGAKEFAHEGKPHEPHYDAVLTRKKIDRTNDFKQAGESWRKHDDREKERPDRQPVRRTERLPEGRP